MRLTAQQRLLLHWVGYPVLVIIVFVMTLHWTFPYDRVKDKLIEVMSAKYDVTIASIEPKFFPGGVVLNSVLLRTRPTTAGEERKTIVVDEVELDIGLLALIGGSYDVDLDARLGDGGIEGAIVYEKKKLVADIEMSSVDLAQIPGLSAALSGMPVKGILSGKLAITLPEHRWSSASGNLHLDCVECAIGDGKTFVKFKPKSSLSAARKKRAEILQGDGLQIPTMNLGEFSGDISIVDGVGTIKQLSGSSEDGEIIIEGTLKFGKKFIATQFPGCVKFKVSEAIKKKKPKFGSAVQLMASRQGDGYRHLRISGSLAGLRFKGTRACDDAKTPGNARQTSARSEPRRRPTLSRSKPATPAKTTPPKRETPPTRPKPATIPPPPSPASASPQRPRKPIERSDRSLRRPRDVDREGREREEDDRDRIDRESDDIEQDDREREIREMEEFDREFREREDRDIDDRERDDRDGDDRDELDEDREEIVE